MRNLEFRAIWNKTGELMGDQAYNGQCFAWLAEGQDITIEQFTGLFDKNGTKIFEGDYLKSYHYTDSEGVDHFITHTVEWSERLSGWYMFGEDDQGDGDGSLQAWVYIKSSSSIEIIGNIHEDN